MTVFLSSQIHFIINDREAALCSATFALPAPEQRRKSS